MPRGLWTFTKRALKSATFEAPHSDAARASGQITRAASRSTRRCYALTIQHEQDTGKTKTEPILRDAVYTASEAAERLRISSRHLRKLVAAGRLRPLPYCVGKFLFSGSELARFIGGEEVAS